ncbi:hypothetical protein POM88_028510 [Heracleum sosnowskyi]|uniref:TF-B3 domain-containing protein n=1 Tax=Heracleum sosnowskyi TaxID=360622 RepID=A0AAD8MGT2_9APIA|nr:hypothetical protein POM88_028510 [Heracleum sosnowskyi]
MVGFVVANFSCFFEFGRIRIPKKFNKRYGPVIPKDIVLMIDNGDRWLCEYDHMSRRIAGLENFMEFYGVGVYWFLVITYFGKDEFGVNIYSPKCCEIFYPKILNAGANIKEKDMGDFKVPLNYSISEENDGWSEFLNEVGIRLGDTCIFECTGKRLEFNICFERQEDNDFIVVNPDLCGVKFFQILFFQSLDHGKIVLPMSLGDRFFNSLSTVVEFVMPNNETWSICYRRNPPSFIFIKEFASLYNLKENFIVVFEYLGHSRFFVRIFEQSSLEISYSKLCKASKTDDIFLKSEYEFGFVKGDSIDVIRFRNIKGIVKDYVRMVDKAYKGPNLLSLWKRKHIFGRFVIVLGSSPIDHKLNNVSVKEMGNHVKPGSGESQSGLVRLAQLHNGLQGCEELVAYVQPRNGNFGINNGLSGENRKKDADADTDAAVLLFNLRAMLMDYIGVFCNLMEFYY